MDPAGEAVRREILVSEPRAPEAPLPWTEAFRTKAVIFATDIVVSGPAQLLNHSALNTDISLYAVQQQRTPQGFEQLAVVRPNVGREVRCQLDGWKLAASNSIRIIARPGPCDVEVIATGDAFWKDVDGHEQRGDKLEFIGKIP